MIFICDITPYYILNDNMITKIKYNIRIRIRIAFDKFNKNNNNYTNINKWI